MAQAASLKACFKSCDYDKRSKLTLCGDINHQVILGHVTMINEAN